ncbi:hypothetical protein SLEP1_g14238 [Rubroshorea leprosula]|uniref:Uncharacterized protein n=1 Tax=Rubroshorea leprosula TaxID=152421 RepID=A0AAV5IP75_9ROSI|nr:hypothetical protein SLEP1_g14238 [Rubroshorea leprosula]
MDTSLGGDDLIVNLLSFHGLQGEGVVFEIPDAPCPILLFFSFLPAAATQKKKKENPAMPLRNRIRICLALLLIVRLLLLCGCDLFGLLLAAGLFPPAAPVLAGELCDPACGDYTPANSAPASGC